MLPLPCLRYPTYDPEIRIGTERPAWPRRVIVCGPPLEPGAVRWRHGLGTGPRVRVLAPAEVGAAALREGPTCEHNPFFGWVS